MLLKRRAPRTESEPTQPVKGFEHLDQDALWLLGWLAEAKVEFVLVGPLAEAIRGRSEAAGPVAIVPAPYRRNLERLARALGSERTHMRADAAGLSHPPELEPVKLTAETLARGHLRTLRVGSRDLDVEGDAPGLGSYQELLYDASRFEPAPGVSVEVAAPEDVERYAHVRRTGIAPEITIRRSERVESDSGSFESDSASFESDSGS